MPLNGWWKFRFQQNVLKGRYQTVTHSAWFILMNKRCLCLTNLPKIHPNTSMLENCWMKTRTQSILTLLNFLFPFQDLPLKQRFFFLLIWQFLTDSLSSGGFISTLLLFPFSTNISRLKLETLTRNEVFS